MNTIYGINGPVVKVENALDFTMLEMVFVGEKRLIGEVIGIDENHTTIQVYENTAGLKVGEPVYTAGAPMCAQLGPGIISNIYDGIQRPLKAMKGIYVTEGSSMPSLDTEKLYDVKVLVRAGDRVEQGQIYATTPETPLILHKCLIPPNVSGIVTFAAASGSYTVNSTVVTVKPDGEAPEITLTLAQKWPIRQPRPIRKRMPISRPLVTGQRIIDTLLPVAKGGAAAIPGGFGTGKTMTQHQIAKWCDADIIVYIVCVERGNEMKQVLE